MAAAAAKAAAGATPAAGLGGPSVGIALSWSPTCDLRPGAVIKVGPAGDGGLAGNAATLDEEGKGARPATETQALRGPSEPPR